MSLNASLGLKQKIITSLNPNMGSCLTRLNFLFITAPCGDFCFLEEKIVKNLNLTFVAPQPSYSRIQRLQRHLFQFSRLATATSTPSAAFLVTSVLCCIPVSLFHVFSKLWLSAFQESQPISSCLV